VEKTVHLVEEDAAVRGILSRLLVSGGYGVREYVSGADLLDDCDTLDGGYILVDIDMPQPDGFAVKLALADRLIDMPMIMMSGYGNLSSLARRAGVAQFLQKPFGRDELLLALDETPAGVHCHA
jgi:two-component system response regulator FixJ